MCRGITSTRTIGPRETNAPREACDVTLLRGTGVEGKTPAMGNASITSSGKRPPAAAGHILRIPRICDTSFVVFLFRVRAYGSCCRAS